MLMLRNKIEKDEVEFLEHTTKYIDRIDINKNSQNYLDEYHGLAIISKTQQICRDIPIERYYSYSREDIYNIAMCIIEKLKHESRCLDNLNMTIITENKNVTIKTGEREIIKSFQCGRVSIETSYSNGKQRLTKLYIDGIMIIGKAKSPWWHQICTEEIISALKVDMRDFSIEQIHNGKYDLVFSAEAAGRLIHEAFGHIFEEDNRHYNKDLVTHLGSRKLHSNLCIEDNPYLKNTWGFSLYDDLGKKTRRLPIIIDGILSDDIRSGKRISSIKKSHYYSVPQYRISNTVMKKGVNNMTELIGSVKRGIYVDRVEQCFCDPVNGRIVLPVLESKFICNGKMIHNLFPFYIISNIVQLVDNIEMISNDYLVKGCVCGKMGDNILVGTCAAGLLIRNIDI